jgi:hypothetical protein
MLHISVIVNNKKETSYCVFVLNVDPPSSDKKSLDDFTEYVKGKFEEKHESKLKSDESFLVFGWAEFKKEKPEPKGKLSRLETPALKNEHLPGEVHTQD